MRRDLQYFLLLSGQISKPHHGLQGLGHLVLLPLLASFPATVSLKFTSLVGLPLVLKGSGLLPAPGSLQGHLSHSVSSSPDHKSQLISPFLREAFPDLPSLSFFVLTTIVVK